MVRNIPVQEAMPYKHLFDGIIPWTEGVVWEERLSGRKPCGIGEDSDDQDGEYDEGTPSIIWKVTVPSRAEKTVVMKVFEPQFDHEEGLVVHGRQGAGLWLRELDTWDHIVSSLPAQAADIAIPVLAWFELPANYVGDGPGGSKVSITGAKGPHKVLMKQYVKRESFLGQPYINFNLVSPIRMMEHFDMLDRLGELFLIVFIWIHYWWVETNGWLGGRLVDLSNCVVIKHTDKYHQKACSEKRKTRRVTVRTRILGALLAGTRPDIFDRIPEPMAQDLYQEAEGLARTPRNDKDNEKWKALQQKLEKQVVAFWADYEAKQTEDTLLQAQGLSDGLAFF